MFDIEVISWLPLEENAILRAMIVEGRYRTTLICHTQRGCKHVMEFLVLYLQFRGLCSNKYSSIYPRKQLFGDQK